jgi:hypothetical protein
VAGGEQMAYSQVYTQVQTVTVLQGDQVRIVHCTALHSLTHCRAAAAAVVPATLLCGSSGVLLRSAWRAWSPSRYNLNRPTPSHAYIAAHCPFPLYYTAVYFPVPVKFPNVFQMLI